MPGDDDHRSAIRVLLAVKDPAKERQLLDILPAAGLLIAGRCLDGPSLVERAQGLDADVALVSSDLHHLSQDTLLALSEARLPVVLLATAHSEEKYGGLAFRLSMGAPDEELVAALRHAAASGASYLAVTYSSGEGEKQTPGADDGVRGQLVALVSGKGAPGVTTLAIALAAAIAPHGRRVVLVDADLRGGNIGPYLDLDPRLGLLGLTFGRNGAKKSSAVENELQDGPGFMVLAGIERPETRTNVSAELATSALTTLRERFDEVVVDVGEVMAGISSPAGDALLRVADRVLVVTTADLVGLWNARSCLRYLREALAIPSDRQGILVNRTKGREHYGAEEVERALGLSVLAVLPEVRPAARRAAAEQLPINSFSKAVAQGLQDVAGHLIERSATTRSRRERGLPGAAFKTLLPGKR